MRLDRSRVRPKGGRCCLERAIRSIRRAHRLWTRSAGARRSPLLARHDQYIALKALPYLAQETVDAAQLGRRQAPVELGSHLDSSPGGCLVSGAHTGLWLRRGAAISQRKGVLVAPLLGDGVLPVGG